MEITASLRGLTALYASRTPLNNAGLNEIAKLPNIKRLMLEETKVTSQEYVEFRAKNPRIMYLASPPSR